jgi:hypothetical protein
MPTARDHHAAAAIDGKLHAIGGRLGGNYSRNLDTHEVYDPARNAWSPRAPLPTPRSGLPPPSSAGVPSSSAGSGPGGTFPQVERTSRTGDRWTAMAPPTPRHGWRRWRRAGSVVSGGPRLGGRSVRSTRSSRLDVSGGAILATAPGQILDTRSRSWPVGRPPAWNHAHFGRGPLLAVPPDGGFYQGRARDAESGLGGRAGGELRPRAHPLPGGRAPGAGRAAPGLARPTPGARPPRRGVGAVRGAARRHAPAGRVPRGPEPRAARSTPSPPAGTTSS